MKIYDANYRINRAGRGSSRDSRQWNKYAIMQTAWRRSSEIFQLNASIKVSLETVKKQGNGEAEFLWYSDRSWQAFISFANYIVSPLIFFARAPAARNCGLLLISTAFVRDAFFFTSPREERVTEVR